MKLSVKLAGLCGSAVFLITALPGFYMHTRPANLSEMAHEVLSGMQIMETLGISLGGAIVAGMIGFIMGDILSNPKKPRKNKRPPSPPPAAPAPTPPKAIAASPPPDTLPADSELEAPPPEAFSLPEEPPATSEPVESA